MTIELLYFEDCPNWKTTADRIDAALTDRHLTATRVLVGSDDDLEAIGFRGSPTILIDGHDPFARGDEPFGFSCRMYNTPDGLAGSPTAEQLTDAIEQHGEEHS